MAKSKFRGSARGGGFNTLTPPYGIIREQQRQSAETIRGLENQQRQTDARAAKAERDLERVQSREEANRSENARLEQTYFDNNIAGLGRNKAQQARNDLNISKANQAKEKRLTDLAALAPSVLEKVMEAKQARDTAIQDNAYNYFIAQGLPTDRETRFNVANEAIKLKSEEVHSQADAMAAAGAPLRVTSNYRQLSKNEELGRVKAYAEMAELGADSWVATWMRESGVDTTDPVAVAAELNKALPAYIRKNNLQNVPIEFLGGLFKRLRKVRNDTTLASEKQMIARQDATRLSALRVRFESDINPQTARELFDGLVRYSQDGKQGSYKVARTTLFKFFEDPGIPKDKMDAALSIKGRLGLPLSEEYPQEYEELIRKRAKNREERFTAIKSQKKARDQQLYDIAYQALKDDDDPSITDVDTLAAQLVEQGVDSEKVKDFRKYGTRITTSEQEKARNAEDLYQIARADGITVEQVLRKSLTTEDRKKLLELAEAREKLIFSGALSEEAVRKQLRNAFRAKAGRPLNNESILGLDAALEDAYLDYKDRLTQGAIAGGITAGDMRRFSQQTLNDVRELIGTEGGKYRISDQIQEAGDRAKERGQGGRSGATPPASLTTPLYFPEFTPRSDNAPQGRAPVEGRADTIRRKGLANLLKSVKIDPSIIDNTLMIPTAELAVLMDDLKAGRDAKIPEIYYAISRSTGGILSAREALTKNAKILDETFEYPLTDLQKEMVDQGANDPQIQQALQSMQDAAEEATYYQAFDGGNTQRVYMSPDVLEYQEGAAALPSLVAAIIGQESSERPGVINEDTQVFGLGQIARENIGPWTRKHLGYTMSPMAFLDDAAAQRKVIEGEFRDRLRKYSKEGYTGEELIRRTAASWYGGPGAVDKWDDPTYHANYGPEPNMQQYTKEVYERFQELGGFGIQAAKTGSNEGIVITSRFDPDAGQGGVDFAISNGAPRAPFYFPFPAKVVKIRTGNDERIYVENGDTRKSPGNYVELTATDPISGHTFDMRCAHFDYVNGSLRVGQQLPANAFIGTQGRSGSTTGYHVSCDAYGVGNTTPDPVGNKILLEYLDGVVNDG